MLVHEQHTSIAIIFCHHSQFAGCVYISKYDKSTDHDPHHASICVIGFNVASSNHLHGPYKDQLEQPTYVLVSIARVGMIMSAMIE